MSTNLTPPPPQADAAAAAAPESSSNSSAQYCSFRVGDLVQVQARTWANMNQPGGVARITGVFVSGPMDAVDAASRSAASASAATSSDAAMPTTTAASSKGPDGSSAETEVYVSVRYVLDGRHERRVHVKYVAMYALQDEQHRFRDRSALLGRCTYCGSLRSDCGSCDQQRMMNPQLVQRHATTKHSSPGRRRRRQPLAGTERRTSLGYASSSDDSTSSSSSADLDKLVARQRHIDRMYRKLQARRLKMQQQQSQLALRGPNRRRRLHDPGVAERSTGNVEGSRRPRRRLQNVQDSLALLTTNPIESNRAVDRSVSRTAHGEAAHFPIAEDDSSTSSSSDDEEVGLGVFLTRHRNRYQRSDTVTGRTDRNRSGGAALLATPSKALADTLDIAASQPPRRRRLDGGVRGAAAPRVRRFRVVQGKGYGDDPRAGTSRQDPSDSQTFNRPTLDDVDPYSSVSEQGQVEQSSSGLSSSERSLPPTTEPAAMSRRSRRDWRRMPVRSDASTTSNTGAPMDLDDSSCGRSYPGGGADDDDEGVPSQLVDLNFVQPEGDAYQLPDDLVDQTAGVPFDQLPAFFDGRLALMRQQLRVAKRELRDLERQQRAAMGTIQAAASTSADWRRSCMAFVDKLIEDLVRNGTDQCELALRKLSSKRRFEQYRREVQSSSQLRSATDLEGESVEIATRKDLLLEDRGLRLDSMSAELEDVVKMAKLMVRRAGSDDEGGGETTSDGGWNDQLSLASASRSSARAPSDDDQSKTFVPPSALGPFDPHEHARFRPKRKRARTDSVRQKHSKGPTHKTSPRRLAKNQSTSSDDSLGISSLARKALPVDNGLRSRSGRSRRDGQSSRRDGQSSQSLGMPVSRKSDHRDHRKGVADSQNEASLATQSTREVRNKGRASTRVGTNRRRRKKDVNMSSDADDHSSDANDSITARRQTAVGSRTLNLLQSEEASSTQQSALLKCRKSDRRASSTRQRYHGESSDASDIEETTQSTIDLTNALFSELDQPREPELHVEQPNDTSSNNIDLLLEQFSRTYPSTSSVRLLTRIRDSLKATLVDDVRVSSSAFKTLLDALRTHGVETLTCFVSRKSENFQGHVHLLTTILQLVQIGAHHLLEEEDGDIYQFFSQDRLHSFINMLMLQCVDVAYALVHPSAWDLHIGESHRLKLLVLLRPLQSALEGILNLPERLSHALVHELPVQTWRVSSDRRHAFVSSVNPPRWEEYLISGQLPSADSSTSRLQLFENVLPRLESEALWRLFAYFGLRSTASKSSVDSNTYWRTIEKIFVCGVLRNEKCTAMPMRPNPTHVVAINVEIRRIGRLLIAGSTPSLPEKDSFVTNLIQRAISIGAVAVESSHPLDRALHPRISNEKVDKKSISSFWKGTLSTGKARISATKAVKLSEIVDGLFRQDVGGSMLGSVRVLPDGVTRCCCGVLVAWISCVPPKNARRSRLRSSIKMLIRDVCSSLASLHPVDSRETNSRTCRIEEAAILEAAAFFVMFSHIVEGNTASPHSSLLRRLGEEVWKLTSEPSVRSHQDALLARTTLECNSPSTASGVRMYISAKAVTFLCLIALGLEPWSEPNRTQQYATSLSQESIAENDLVFFASCLSSCLACSCLGADAREVAVSVASMIGLFISRAHQLMTNAAEGVIPGRVGSSLEKLRDEVPRMFLPTLCHSISSTIITSCIGAIESLLFESLLGLVQVVAAFVRHDDRRVISSVPGAGDGPDASLIASTMEADLDSGIAIDDSLRTEIGETAGNRHGSSQSALLRQVSDCIIRLIEEAKPSEAFSIRMSSSLSSQAKSLVTRHNSSLCRSIAAVAASEDGDACTSLLSRMFASIQAASNSPEDLDYFKLSTRRVIDEMLLMSECSKCVAEALVASTDQIVRLALESLVDSRPLDSLPTCNLTRIRASCGESGEKLEFSRLLEIADERRVSCTKETTSIWKFASSIGKCFSRFDASDRHVAIGNCFVHVDQDIANLPHDLRPLSLECECFQRFRLFRAIVSSGAALDLPWIVSVFVPSSSSVLKQLDEALAASHEVRDAAPAGLDLRPAKMLELFDCYLCFHISVIAWILRTGSSSSSLVQMTLFQSLGDDYLRRSLQKKPLVAVQSESTAKHPLDAIYPSSILNRCRELVIYSSQVLSRSNGESPGSLFESLLTAALEDEERGAFLFCHAFCSRPHLLRLSQDCPQTEAPSPLQATIDSYFDRLEASATSRVPPVDVAALLQLKRFLLKRLVAPRLCLNLSESNRIGLLRLLRNLFEMEREELVDVDDQPRLDVDTLALLVRGIRVILQNALASSTVSEDLITSVYRCGLALANLPSATVDQRAVGWLVDWCDDGHSDLAEYLRSFFDWIREVGEKIVDASNLKPLHQYVAELQALKAIHWQVTLVAVDPSSQTASWQRLVTLENRVCPVPGRARPITNAYYASRQATRHGETSEPSPWVPSRGLRLVVNLLVGKVQCSRESSMNDDRADE